MHLRYVAKSLIKIKNVANELLCGLFSKRTVRLTSALEILAKFKVIEI